MLWSTISEKGTLAGSLGQVGYLHRLAAHKRIGGQRQTAGQQYPQRKIAARGTVRRSKPGVPQRKHFETGKPGARVGKVFAFFPSDCRDRAQHDRGRRGARRGQRRRPALPKTRRAPNARPARR